MLTLLFFLPPTPGLATGYVILCVRVAAPISYLAKEYGTLLQKAVFVSGRDTPSIERFAGILGDASTPAVRPDGVRLVRDPVLSDQAFTDTDGTCWRQSSGEWAGRDLPPNRATEPPAVKVARRRYSGR